MQSKLARAAVAAIAAAGFAMIAGCTGAALPTGAARPMPVLTESLPTGPSEAADIPVGPAADWPTYGRDAAHTGVAAGLAPAGALHVAWRARLDGAVYGQPLLVGDLVIAATENDSLYGLSPSTGAVVWRTHVGTPVPLSDLPCGDINPLGITGTPVYDHADGIVYAVAETTGYRHLYVGVQAVGGELMVEQNIATPDGRPRYDQQRPALTVEDGRVYIAFGGLDGDCGPYRGSVVSLPVVSVPASSGTAGSYVVPTAREGAIWGTAGPVAGPDGTLYVSVGNGSVTSTSFDGTDAVTALSPALRQVGIFAPSSWHADSKHDLDLGSTEPALLADGRLLALGKSGTAYLIDSAHPGGVGGQLAQARVCPAYGAAAVAGSTVYEPCEQGGMAAISTAGDKLRVLWRGPSAAWGSPVIGGGAVWVTDWTAGTLYELNPATGTPRASLPLGTSLPHFSSMSMAGSRAYLGTDDGVLAVGGV